MGQRLKRLPAMWKTWVQSLGWEDLLEKEMATHSSILAWRIPWTEKDGGLESMGSQRVGHDRATSLSLFMPSISQPLDMGCCREGRGLQPPRQSQKGWWLEVAADCIPTAGTSLLFG